MRNLKGIIVTVAIMVTLTADANAQIRPDNVLFIGNSLTYSRGGVDTMLNNLCAAAGIPMNAQRETVGGMRLSEHAVRTETLARIRLGGWDVVVLQGASDDVTTQRTAFFAAAHTLDTVIRSIGARTVLYMTWSTQDRVAAGTMKQTVADAYTELGEELDAMVVPCGLAFDSMYDAGVRMYDDNVHPSEYAVYMVGCMFYAALLDTSPLYNGYYAAYQIGRVVSNYIQRVAWYFVDGPSIAVIPSQRLFGAPAMQQPMGNGFRIYDLKGRAIPTDRRFNTCIPQATVAIPRNDIGRISLMPSH
jgi:hypothetical protein